MIRVFAIHPKFFFFFGDTFNRGGCICRPVSQSKTCSSSSPQDKKSAKDM